MFFSNAHNRPILNTRVMRDAKDAPNDNVLVDDALSALHRIRHTLDLFLALKRIAPPGIQLAVAVLGHPDMMLCKARPTHLDGIRVCEEELRRQWSELVRDRSAADGVLGCGVCDFDDTIEVRRGVEPRRALDGGGPDFVKVALRVRCLILRYRVGFLNQDGIAVTIDGRVDAHAEEVLVVLRQDAGPDDIAVVALLAWIDVDNTDDAGGARFDRDPACLVELVGEDVLVVGERDDELHNQLAAADHDGALRAPVGVLPANAVVLLVEADHVGHGFGLAIAGDCDCVKVLSFSLAFSTVNLWVSLP